MSIVIVPNMPSTNIPAFFQKFPWISNHIDEKDVQTVLWKKFDPSTIHRSPERKDMGESVIPIFVTELFLILNEHGQFLVRVGIEEIPATPGYRWWKPWTYPRTENKPKETIHDAIIRLRQTGGNHTIGFILSEFNGHIVVHEIPEDMILMDLAQAPPSIPHFKRVRG